MVKIRKSEDLQGFRSECLCAQTRARTRTSLLVNIQAQGRRKLYDLLKRLIGYFVLLLVEI